MLTCYVVPVDLPVQLLVGGAEVDGGGQLEHGLVQTVQVAVLGGVDQHGGAGQRRVEPVVGQILTLSARIEVMNSAANRLIGKVVQSRRRPLLGPAPG